MKKDQYENLYENIEPINRSVASLVVKTSYTRSDYAYYRDGVTQLETKNKKIQACKDAYDNNGLVNNTIDLMGDFGSKGIKITHPDEKIQKFINSWSKKVNIEDRTERILNCLYKTGIVYVHHIYGRASNSYLSKYIPIKYTLLNPTSIEIKQEKPGIINDNIEYILRFTGDEFRNSYESTSVYIPKTIEKNAKNSIPLNKNKLSVFHYRKDDWELYGHSIIYPILSDLEVYEKLRLADISALDGATSNIRLWTVGKITDNPQTTIIPTNAQLKKIQSIIEKGVNGGSLDLVMGPEVSFTESSTDVHNFLGADKYSPTLDAIYNGLGIPYILRNGGGGSNANSVISLKTLIERLEYGRKYIVDFWVSEIKKVLNILGIEYEIDPTVEFDVMILTDEAAEKKLLIELADRQLIDSKLIHSRFKINTDVVNAGLKSDEEKRNKGEIPEKAGPFDKFDKPQESGPGRPLNITETSKRNKKGTGPSKTTGELIVWATNAQHKISNICTPAILKKYNKKDVRSLTKEESNILEIAKASVLLHLEPYQDINESIVFDCLSKGRNKNLNNLLSIIDEYESKIKGLTMEQKRQINSIFYSEINNGEG